MEILNEPQPGYYMVRCCRNCPEAPARIWLCHHEPGEPSNEVDQPYLQGQIGLDLEQPYRIWTSRRRRISREQYEYQVAVLRWLKANQPNDPRLWHRQPITTRDLALPEF